MSRSTQFIGLTDGCAKQVRRLTVIYSRGWHTTGMFDEEIQLASYWNDDGGLVAVEYVLATPWSSGPMIFTGLMFPNGPSTHNWEEARTRDEIDGQEYDPVKGLYYV